MNRDDLQEFIANSVYYTVPSSTVAQMMADTRTMDIKSFKDKWNDTLEKSSDGWKEFIGDNGNKSVAERITSAFGSDDKKNPFRRSDNYIDKIYEKQFKGDVPREQFDTTLKKMRDYYDQFAFEQEKEAGRLRRQKEVKDWGLGRQMLTSDYEKLRYIDDPKAALFGDEAPSIGSAENTRWGSMADLGLGAAGAVGDALPGWGSMAGPLVRTARDIGHKLPLTDSPYQMEWGDIGKNLIADAGFSASTAWLPNFRRARRMESGGFMPKAISETVAIEKDAENMYKGANVLHELVNGSPRIEQFGDNVKDRYFRETVHELPNSPLKDELLPLTKQQNIDWGKARAIVNNNAFWGLIGLNPETGKRLSHALIDEGVGIPQQVANQAAAETIVKTGVPGGAQIPMATAEEIPDFVNRLYHAPTLTTFQQKTKPAWVMFDKFLSGNLGGAALQETKTLTGGRSPKQAERVETAEEREEIEAIKKREAPFWDKDGKPWFKPRKDNSLLYKAWKEFAQERGWEVND